MEIASNFRAEKELSIEVLKFIEKFIAKYARVIDEITDYDGLFEEIKPKDIVNFTAFHSPSDGDSFLFMDNFENDISILENYVQSDFKFKEEIFSNFLIYDTENISFKTYYNRLISLKKEVINVARKTRKALIYLESGFSWTLPQKNKKGHYTNFKVYINQEGESLLLDRDRNAWDWLWYLRKGLSTYSLCMMDIKFQLDNLLEPFENGENKPKTSLIADVKLNTELTQIIKDLEKVPSLSRGITPYIALFTYCLNESNKISPRLIGEKDVREFAKKNLKLETENNFKNAYSKMKNSTDARIFQVDLLKKSNEGSEIYQKYDKLLTCAYK
jgi:hypothetical protein